MWASASSEESEEATSEAADTDCYTVMRLLLTFKSTFMISKEELPPRLSLASNCMPPALFAVVGISCNLSAAVLYSCKVGVIRQGIVKPDMSSLDYKV